MSDPNTGRALDGFEEYYFRKLRSWIPELYWSNDLENGSLEVLIRAMSDRLAEMRREIERVWTASSIELADDWAVKYLGDLVGAETLSAQNSRANRTVAANFMNYHRRKTTRYLLDSQITDIVATEGYVREIERWLARPPHELDMGYLRFAPLSEGPVGGLPELTGPRVDDAALPAFDEFARLPDFGPREGRAASFDYATIHFNLFASESWRVDMATPFWLDGTRLTLDPSGRAAPLFHSATFDHRAGLWPVGPEEFPLPMRCARFNDARFEITEDALDAIASPGLTAALTPWIGVTFRTRQAFQRILADQLSPTLYSNFRSSLLRECLVADCAKARQIEADMRLDIGPFADTRVLDPYEIVAANLSRWMPAAQWPEDAALLIDVSSGYVQLAGAPDDGAVPPQLFHPLFHHLGLVHRVGAGTFPRESDVDLGPGFNDANAEVSFAPPASGLQAFGDNRRYLWNWPASRRFEVAGELRLEAADRTRPYVVSRTDDPERDFTIVGTDGQDNHLTIDGLWLGLQADTPIETAVGGPDDPAPPARARLILDGHFETVILRHVSLDPGGEQARPDPGTARAIPAVTVEIEGSVRLLRIERSITGPIVETRADPSLLNAGEIRISDSIVQSGDPERPAISVELARLHLTNSTVLGACHANLIFATNTLFDGPLYVTNRHQSCLRFSAVAAFEGDSDPSILPRRFECVEYKRTIPPASFRSTRFGDLDFAALSDLADRGLLHGGEGRTEIGVGNARFWHQRRDDLARVASTFLPVGQNAQIYEETGGRT
ncbi:hypothetical protein [Halomonas stenophila]|uniref:Uncharacterized protein n=1 Tax=Halomonas stenophila TaxID=795312 RepID=A0A7W5HMF1_9GAMM|nr:hypothetical protein [Halomonas stenophila]MBB3232258.1 hypothetical protein [Halomonas stenophila]